MDNRNVFVAIALSLAVLLFWSAFFETPKPVNEKRIVKEKQIENKNKANGRFIFTTEHNEKKDFCFEESGRYSHSKTYIEKLCKDFNYNLTYFKTINLRKERKE